MKREKLLFTVLAAGLFCLASAGTAADPQDEATKKELKALEGVWGMASASDAIGDITNQFGHLKITFNKGKWRGDVDDTKGGLGSGTVALDVARKVKTMDLSVEVANDKKDLYLYELKGDQLKLCFIDPTKTEYPDGFKDDRATIWVFKRLK